MVFNSFKVKESEVSKMNDLVSSLTSRERISARAIYALIGCLLLCAVVAIVFRFHAGSAVPLEILKHADVPSLDWGSVSDQRLNGVSEPLEDLVSTLSDFSGSVFVKFLGAAAVLFGAAVGLAKQTIAPAIAGMMMAIGLTVIPSMFNSMTGVGQSRDQESAHHKILINTIEKSKGTDFSKLIPEKINNASQYALYFSAQQHVFSGQKSDPDFAAQVSELATSVEALKADPAVYEVLERNAYGEVKSDFSKAYLRQLQEKREHDISIANIFTLGAMSCLLAGAMAFGFMFLVRRNRMAASKSLSRSLDMLRSYEAAQTDPA